MPSTERVRLLDAAGITRVLTRIAHEILERNKNLDGLSLVGIRTRGVPLAHSVCEEAIARLATGVRLVGGMFECDTVSYALIGSVARSDYIREGLTKALAPRTDKHYVAVEPALSPTAGAVLIALRRQGVTVDRGLIERLRSHTRRSPEKE